MARVTTTFRFKHKAILLFCLFPDRNYHFHDDAVSNRKYEFNKKKSYKIVYYCAANVECEQCNFLYLSLASKALNVCFTISYFICITSCFHILYVYNIRRFKMMCEKKLLNLNVEIILVHTSSTKRQELQSADLKKRTL